MTRNLSRRLWISAALVLAGCGAAASPTPAQREVAGTVRLNNNDPVVREGGDCAGTGGFDDISTAAQVVVKDDAGKIVGTSNLVAVPRESTDDRREHYLGGRRCDFTFSVTVPDAPFYEIEVGDRGSLTYPREEAGDVAMSIGDEEQ